MKIDEKNIYFWSLLGFKIGRLEFLWDSPYKEAQDAFEEAKSEVLSMIDAEVPVRETDYHAFAESIVFYYMKNDMEKFSLLMIGRCIQRCGLINVCKDAERKETMRQLASGCLSQIPPYVVKDKSLLFSIILKNRDKSMIEIIPMIYEAVFSDNINEEEYSEDIREPEKSDAKCEKTDRYLFISYSSKDYDMASKVREMLEDKDIACWMAPESILGGEDYSDVIVDAIEKSSGVVLILTENSQESKWVPKELDIAITADKIIFPVHMDSSAIIKKIHFRITDSQVIEAYGNVNSAFEPLIKAIHSMW